MSELRTDSREWVHRIMGSLDRMLAGLRIRQSETVPHWAVNAA